MTIKFYLNICSSMPDDINYRGKAFQPGFQGEVEFENEQKGEMLHLEIPFCGGHKPFLGNASHIQAVSIRACPSSVSIIAIYDNVEMNAMGECWHCANGCSVYGSGGGACEV